MKVFNAFTAVRPAPKALEARGGLLQKSGRGSMRMALLAVAWVMCGCTTVVASDNPPYEPQRVISTRDYMEQAELDQLLAPIALYPDTVLSQS